MPYGQNHTAPFAPQQQFPSLFQTTTIHEPQGLSFHRPFDWQAAVLKAEHSLPNLDEYPKVTHKLPEEDLQQERDTAQQQASERTEYYVSHQNIEKLLKPFVLLVAIVDTLYIALILWLWPLPTYVVGLAMVIALLALCSGKLAETGEIKWFCTAFFLLLWAIGGYICGLHIYESFGGQPGSSFEVGIELICAIFTIAIGGRMHFQLFYH